MSVIQSQVKVDACKERTLRDIQRSVAYDHVELVQVASGGVGQDDGQIEELHDLVKSQTSFSSGQFHCPEEADLVTLNLDCSEESTFLQRIDFNDVFSTCKWLFAKSGFNLFHLERVKPQYNSEVFLWRSDGKGQLRLVFTILRNLGASGYFHTLSLMNA